jgi:hypothetical protein
MTGCPTKAEVTVLGVRPSWEIPDWEISDWEITDLGVIERRID